MAGHVAAVEPVSGIAYEQASGRAAATPLIQPRELNALDGQQRGTLAAQRGQTLGQTLEQAPASWTEQRISGGRQTLLSLIPRHCGGCAASGTVAAMQHASRDRSYNNNGLVCLRVYSRSGTLQNLSVQVRSASGACAGACACRGGTAPLGAGIGRWNARCRETIPSP